MVRTQAGIVWCRRCAASIGWGDFNFISCIFKEGMYVGVATKFASVTCSIWFAVGDKGGKEIDRWFLVTTNSNANGTALAIGNEYIATLAVGTNSSFVPFGLVDKLFCSRDRKSLRDVIIFLIECGQSRCIVIRVQCKISNLWPMPIVEEIEFCRICNHFIGLILEEAREQLPSLLFVGQRILRLNGSPRYFGLVLDRGP